MIVVRRCMDRDALAKTLLPICQNELSLEGRVRPLTLECLVMALKGWDIVEFFDTEKRAIIGAAAREPNRCLHIYVDRARRISWAPHSSLEAVLDIFLSDSDCLYAAIPVANWNTISMVRKLGFIQTGSENGTAHFVVTCLTRRHCWRQTRGPNECGSRGQP